MAGRFLYLRPLDHVLFGYIVRLDVSFILDGGDRKHTLRKGVIHVKQ
jgi:hypothetical protein